MEEHHQNGSTVTNFEKWRYYLKDLVSPQSYVDWGYFYLIAASLQRRVWLPPEHNKLFPNMYVIPVGEPGLGKGLVIKRVSEILRYHRIIDPTNVNANGAGQKPTDKDAAEIKEAIEQANYKAAQENEDSYGLANSSGVKKSFEKPLLIPIAADATTYEALIRSMSKALRRKDYQEWSEKMQKNVTKIYVHSSLAFCLEEISSLFRKKSEDVAKFLLNAYDCGDYEYDTKTQGRDRIRKCCLNFFGGTTPGFMQDVFSDRLLTDGFAARTFFIYETKNRSSGFFIPELNPLQIEYKQHIIDHVKKLTDLYGQVVLGEGVVEFLESWWKEWESKRSNASLKLDSYYSRKKVHVLKLAMAIHFGETTDMTIEIPSFQRAIEVLAEAEKKMHFALSFDNKNPLYRVSKLIHKFLAVQGRKTYKELLAEMYPELPAPPIQSLNECIEYMQSVDLLRTASEKDNRLGEDVIYYDVVNKDQK